MRNGPFTLDEVFDRITESLNLPEETNELYYEFVDADHSDEDTAPLIDLSPVQESVGDGHVYRVSVNESDSGNQLATAVFPSEEQGTQVIDLLLLLQEISEHGLE